MKLLDQIRHLARAKHFSYRTEQCYVYWAERYIRFHCIRHPHTMGAAEAEEFLTHLDVKKFSALFCFGAHWHLFTTKLIF